MADVFSAVILDNDYWDGTTSWAGEVDEAARDAKYGARRYTSLAAWETARDGVAQAADDEYANIFGPWAAHDTAEVVIQVWTNPPAGMIIQTIGTDARSQDGKFDSNSCYVLENDSAAHNFDINQAGHTITIEGLQFEVTNVAGDNGVRNDNSATLIVSKCYFYENGDQQSIAILSDGVGVDTYVVNCVGTDYRRFVLASDGVLNVYNCTVTGSPDGDALHDNGCTSTGKNNAVFDNNSDFLAFDTLDSNATDEGAGEGTNGLDISGTWDTTCFTDQGNGDYSIEADSPLVDASTITLFDDANVPSDDIIGNPRNVGEGETVDIGAYAFVAAGVGAIMNQLQTNNLGADLYNGTLL